MALDAPYFSNSRTVMPKEAFAPGEGERDTTEVS